MDQRRSFWLIVMGFFLLLNLGLPITPEGELTSEILPSTPKIPKPLTETVALSVILAPETTVPVPTLPTATAVRRTPAARASRSRIPGRRTVASTAYCLQGTMANGQKVHSGAVAMNEVKLGSQFRDVNTGEIFTVKDRIGHGSDFDIWMASCAAAIKYGRRTRTLEQVN